MLDHFRSFLVLVATRFFFFASDSKVDDTKITRKVSLFFSFTRLASFYCRSFSIFFSLLHDLEAAFKSF